MTVTAGWPLPLLVDKLAVAGWGPLAPRRAGGLRGVLNSLARLLPPGSALGEVTASQLADTAGISERWARSCLAVLEAADVITWTRGTIVDGQPTPSIIRVSKRALADLVLYARRELPKKLRARAQATADRIRETLRQRTIHRNTRQRRRPSWATPPAPSKPSPRAELRQPPSPYGEGLRPRSGADGPATPPGTIIMNQIPKGKRSETLRRLLTEQRRC